MTGRSRPLRLGTRASALARTQSESVATALRRSLRAEVELVEVSTQGDVDSRTLVSIGGAGVFVASLRAAVAGGAVDLAVHSLKDLPTGPAVGLALAAVPTRADPRDALVAAGGRLLADLPAGARVGTGSPRRAAQLGGLRPDLDIVAVRGNVDTRIARVRRGELDAVVLAAAGLARLGRLGEAEVLDVDTMLPAPGQGALAVECRQGDTGLVDDIAGALDDSDSRVCVIAERALLGALEAGCSAPVGALAERDGDRVHLRAVLADVGRRGSLVGGRSTEEAEALGRRLAGQLLAEGARSLVTQATGQH